MPKCSHCNWTLRQGFDSGGVDYWCVNPNCTAYALFKITGMDNLESDEHSIEMPEKERDWTHVIDRENL